MTDIPAGDAQLGFAARPAYRAQHAAYQAQPESYLAQPGHPAKPAYRAQHAALSAQPGYPAPPADLAQPAYPAEPGPAAVPPAWGEPAARSTPGVPGPQPRTAVRYKMTPWRAICGVCWAIWTVLFAVAAIAGLSGAGIGQFFGCAVLGGLAGWYDYRIWTGRSRRLTLFIIF
jgi:hypothetical protein